MVDHDVPAMSLTLSTASPDETRAIAATLGGLCRGGELFLLQGDLGSGKTCFVQGLARGLLVPEELHVASPTFTIHAEYPGRLILNHLDLYRLEDASSPHGLVLDDMLIDAGAVTAVEWPEIMPALARGERLEVRLADAGDDRRDIAVFAYGDRHARLLAAASDS